MVKEFIIADNQAITREGLHSLIRATWPDYPVADVTDRAALEGALARSRQPIVVIDFDLFDMPGATGLEGFSEQSPLVHWVLFGAHIDDALIDSLGRDPSVSMVLKTSSREEIVTALSCAVRGERYLCHQLTNRLLRGLTHAEAETLTNTEHEVLRLIAYGKTVKEIAAERNSSVHTIITHKKNIFRKIGVGTTHDATRYALRTGLIDIEYYI